MDVFVKPHKRLKRVSTPVIRQANNLLSAGTFHSPASFVEWTGGGGLTVPAAAISSFPPATTLMTNIMMMAFSPTAETTQRHGAERRYRSAEKCGLITAP